MTSAPRDNNHVPVELGTSNADGITPLVFKADPVTHRLKVSIASTGSSISITNANRDANRVPVVMAVSKSDNSTPLPIYMDSSTNALLTTTS